MEIGALNAAAAAKYLANVDKTGSTVDVQKLFSVASSGVTKPDFNDPTTRAEARIGNFANAFMDKLLDDGGAFNWTV